MKGLSNRLFREKTAARTQGMITYNAPGSYPIPYGKTHFYVSGQGQPGTNTEPGTLAGYNPDTGGNIAYYNPTNGGNIANYNPDTGGNIANYNPDTGGTLAGYNPPTGGNYAYTNATYKWGNSYTDYTDATYGVHDYSNNDHPWGPSINQPSPYTYTANPGSPGYSVVNYYVIGTTPGNDVYNPIKKGTAYYNPIVKGTANYNPIVKGTANYNPTVPGTANYNPVVKGNAYYNPDKPGQPGQTFTVGGVSFPGGDGDQPGPRVERTLAKIPYTSSGQLILSVPPGAYVIIENVN